MWTRLILHVAFTSLCMAPARADVLDDITPGVIHSLGMFDDAQKLKDMSEWADKALDATRNGNPIPPPPTANVGVAILARHIDEYKQKLDRLKIPEAPKLPNPRSLRASPDLNDRLRKEVARHEARLSYLKSQQDYANKIAQSLSAIDQVAQQLSRKSADLAGSGLDIAQTYAYLWYDFEVSVPNAVSPVLSEANDKANQIGAAISEHMNKYDAWDAVARDLANNFNYDEWKRLERESLMQDNRAATAEANNTMAHSGRGGSSWTGTVTATGATDRLISRRDQDVQFWILRDRENFVEVKPSEPLIVKPGERVLLVPLYPGDAADIVVQGFYADGSAEKDPTIFHGSCGGQNSSSATFWKNESNSPATLWVSSAKSITKEDGADSQASRARLKYSGLFDRSQRIAVRSATVWAWGYRAPRPASTPNSPIRGGSPHSAALIAIREQADRALDLQFARRVGHEIFVGPQMDLRFAWLNALTLDFKLAAQNNVRISDRLSFDSGYVQPYDTGDGITVARAIFRPVTPAANSPPAFFGNWLNPDLFVGELGTSEANPSVLISAIRETCHFSGH